MKIITINTYAGSLLLGAKFANIEVERSLEDSNYGVSFQRDNFPDLEVITDRDHWPDISLRDTPVIAHPPCAAFSAANTIQASARGVNADKFKCTVGVMRYAMGLGTPALMIESVTGAAKGACEVHESIAQEYGYNIARIFQNARTFGVPQNRRRFWILFLRKNIKQQMLFDLAPGKRDVLTIGVLLGELGPRVVDKDHHKRYNRQMERFLSSPCNQWYKHALLSTPGRANNTLRKLMGGAPLTTRNVADWWFDERYEAHIFRVLHPAEPAPTLVFDSLWRFPERDSIESIQGGRVDGLLSIDDYKHVMGFPRKYKMTGTHRDMQFLSRGVVPQVAAWILRNVVDHLEEREPAGRDVVEVNLDGDPRFLEV